MLENRSNDRSALGGHPGVHSNMGQTPPSKTIPKVFQSTSHATNCTNRRNFLTEVGHVALLDGAA